MLLLLTFIFSIIPVSAKDFEVTDIKELRIALKTYYYNKEKITAYNSDMLIGYENESDYDMEMWFSGYDHYSFEALNGYFLTSSTYYSSYDDAKTVSDNLQALGYPAFPGVKGPAEWYIYMGRYESVDNAQVALNDINSSMKNMDFAIIEDLGQLYKMSADGNVLVIVDCEFNKPQFMAVDNNGITNLGDRQYRGRVEYGIYGNDSISAINIIGLEEYLYGVLPSEVYYKWEMEALKAQAVAARTYAVYTAFVAPKYASEPYDLDDTVYCQVYKGYGIEEERTNQAVTQTLGQFILHDNEPIAAFFFSTSGGHTESSENVWVGQFDYLKAVSDIEETEPEKDPWIKIMTAEEVESVLVEKGEDIGEVLTMEVLSYAESGRAMELLIVGTEGSVELTKGQIRWLGLYSTKFTLITDSQYVPSSSVLGQNGTEQQNLINNNLQVITSDGQTSSLAFTEGQVIVSSAGNLQNYTNVQPSNGTYIFAGMGYGHGVGMSQAGAQSMALTGSNYIEILTHYFMDVTIEPLY